jgi:hypothetical protein
LATAPCLPNLCLCQLTMPVYPEDLVLGGEGVVGCEGVCPIIFTSSQLGGVL